MILKKINIDTDPPFNTRLLVLNRKEAEELRDYFIENKKYELNNTWFTSPRKNGPYIVVKSRLFEEKKSGNIGYGYEKWRCARFTLNKIKNEKANTRATSIFKRFCIWPDDQQIEFRQIKKKTIWDSFKIYLRDQTK